MSNDIDRFDSYNTHLYRLSLYLLSLGRFHKSALFPLCKMLKVFKQLKMQLLVFRGGQQLHTSFVRRPINYICSFQRFAGLRSAPYSQNQPICDFFLDKVAFPGLRARIPKSPYASHFQINFPNPCEFASLAHFLLRYEILPVKLYFKLFSLALVPTVILKLETSATKNVKLKFQFLGCNLQLGLFI